LIELIDGFEYELVDVFGSGVFEFDAVEVHDLHVYVIFFQDYVQLQDVFCCLVGEEDFFGCSRLYVKLMVAQIQLVHGIADLHYIFLHHLLANYQFSEVDDVLKFLDDSLKPHHFQILIKFNVFNDECKANGLIGADHEMFEHVDNIIRLVDSQRLQVDKGDFADLGLQV
jgi:hypothetical protein